MVTDVENGMVISWSTVPHIQYGRVADHLRYYMWIVYYALVP